VRVTEGPGVFRAMQRSGELTSGSRWKILLLFLVYLLAAFVLSVVFGILRLFGEEVTNFVIQPVLNTFVSLLLTVGVAALYYELRRNKEGVGPESLAAIFD
jgi:ABC-type arginine/histidine transport system permease subunit